MRTALKAIVSVLVVLTAIYNGYFVTHSWGLPFNLEFVDGRTMVIGENPGIPMPAPLKVGDRIDLTQLDFHSRSVIDVQYNGRTVPAGATYTFRFERDGAAFIAPVTTVPLPPSRGLHVVEVNTILLLLIVTGIGLLLIWRGRDRAAVGLAAWCACFDIGVTFNALPFDGWPGVVAISLSLLFFLSQRAGFFVMADYLAAPVLPRRVILAFRGAFALAMLVGGAEFLGGTLMLATSGDAELLLPHYTFIYSWIYVVPVAMLFAGYWKSSGAGRVRLAWVAVAGLLICAGVTITNANDIGFLYSYSLGSSLFMISIGALTYALLRHRLVAVALVIDRALVYGLMTTLVVGVVAAVNSVLLRETLPPGANLALQVIVPLALGIVLGRVREYLDRLVERVFFRAKYLSEKALRSFARHVGHFDDATSLLDAAAMEIHRHAHTPAVAIYSAEDSGYRCLKQAGEAAFPVTLKNDDAALVAVRAERRAIDLASLNSALGEDACVFPMMVLGNLRGVIVCKNRPGEHFGADEKRLLTHVAREVGAAWRILRARDNEAYVRLMAEGELSLKAAREKARALTVAWAGG